MKFIIGGQVFTIESLDPGMDQAFIDLHAAFLSNQALSWNKFKSIAIVFFDNHHSEHVLTGGFF